MHGNIQKSRALMIQQKSDFFIFFSKAVKKINLRKAVKKNQFVTDFFYMQIFKKYTVFHAVVIQVFLLSV